MVTELKSTFCLCFLPSCSFSAPSGLVPSPPPYENCLITHNCHVTSASGHFSGLISLEIQQPLEQLTTPCFLKHSWLLYHSPLSVSSSSFYPALNVGPACLLHRLFLVFSHLCHSFMPYDDDVQISQSRGHSPKWQTLTQVFFDPVT